MGSRKRRRGQGNDADGGGEERTGQEELIMRSGPANNRRYADCMVPKQKPLELHFSNGGFSDKRPNGGHFSSLTTKSNILFI